MRFSMLPSLAVLSISTSVLAQTTQTTYYEVTYSSKYNDTSASVDILACGSQLAAEGYTTLGSIEGNIAGFANITSTDTSLCGECYVLEYAGAFLNVVVVDTVTNGFVTTQGAYDNWVGSLAGQNPIPPNVDGRVVEGPDTC